MSARFDELRYEVFEPELPPDVLRISTSGSLHYTSHTNSSRLQRPEAGQYEGSLSNGELESLQVLLQTPPLATLPDHSGAIHPGEPYRMIRYIIGSSSTDKAIASSRPTNPRLDAIVSRLGQLVEATRSQPVRVFRIDFREPFLKKANRLLATFSLTSVGTMPVTCRNPSVLIRADEGGVRLELWPDKPQPELKATDLVAIPIALVEELSLRADAAPKQADLVMAPGSSAVFRIEADLPSLSSGDYLVRAVYAATGSEVGRSASLPARIYSPTATVRIPPSDSAPR